jgi:hypothetical protein
VTASEFAFLGLGLILGVATGAAIVEVLRARPSNPREVRVTVTPGSIPGRAATLSTSPFAEAAGPARGGPGDRRLLERVATEGARRASGRGTGWTGVPTPTGLLGRTSVVRAPGAGFGIEVRPEARPGAGLRAALRAAEARAAVVLGSSEAGADVNAAGGGASVAVAGQAEAVDTPSPGSAGGATPSTAEPRAPIPAPGRAAAAPCEDARRVAEERCAVATSARDRADGAAKRLRDLRHQYDQHHERADAAAAAGDPVRIRAAKDLAQRSFREARDRARSRLELEDAARTWLAEINAINASSRGAGELAARERATATELVPALERAGVEADAARIAADAAEEACVAARQALADCEETQAAAAAEAVTAAARPGLQPDDMEREQSTIPATAPSWPPAARAASASLRSPAVVEDADEADDLAAAAADGEPLVLVLLRGDRSALVRVAEALGGTDPAARRSWTLEIGRFVEAIVDRAIEASALDFPTDHPFWGAFTRSQNRDIAAALASLGFRFDGLGGWVDDHVPTQRDLSLAVGYAGLDPMRIRQWPNESDAAALFADVRVAAGEYVTEAAGGFSLGELVSLLGRRADALTEVWNAWGRIRPILLEPSR